MRAAYNGINRVHCLALSPAWCKMQEETGKGNSNKIKFVTISLPLMIKTEFSFIHQSNIKQTSDENKEKY